MAALLLPVLSDARLRPVTSYAPSLPRALPAASGGGSGGSRAAQNGGGGAAAARAAARDDPLTVRVSVRLRPVLRTLDGPQADGLPHLVLDEVGQAVQIPGDAESLRA